MRRIRTTESKKSISNNDHVTFLTYVKSRYSKNNDMDSKSFNFNPRNFQGDNFSSLHSQPKQKSYSNLISNKNIMRNMRNVSSAKSRETNNRNSKSQVASVYSNIKSKVTNLEELEDVWSHNFKLMNNMNAKIKENELLKKKILSTIV